MITFAGALLLSSGCDGVAVPATPVQPAGYVVRAQGLNPQAALREVNAHRRVHGLKPLVLDQRLTRAAGVSARYQASHGRIGHRGAGGSRAWDRARSAGYSPVLTTENVASGQKSFGEAMRGWEQSRAQAQPPSAGSASGRHRRQLPKRPRLLHPGPRGGVAVHPSS